MALATDMSILYPVICSFQDLNSKIFLVNDLVAGQATLLDPRIQSVVTGGVVSQCSPLALKAINSPGL